MENGKTEYLAKYLSQFKKDSLYEKAFELWINYYYWTEKYDKSICSRTDNKGVAVPVNSWERSLIYSNARIRMNELASKAVKLGIKQTTLDSAQHEVLRLTPEYIDYLYWEFQCRS
jgi:hypothetical protein